MLPRRNNAARPARAQQSEWRRRQRAAALFANELRIETRQILRRDPEYWHEVLDACGMFTSRKSQLFEACDLAILTMSGRAGMLRGTSLSIVDLHHAVLRTIVPEVSVETALWDLPIAVVSNMIRSKYLPDLLTDSYLRRRICIEWPWLFSDRQTGYCYYRRTGGPIDRETFIDEVVRKTRDPSAPRVDQVIGGAGGQFKVEFKLRPLPLCEHHRQYLGLEEREFIVPLWARINFSGFVKDCSVTRWFSVYDMLKLRLPADRAQGPAIKEWFISLFDLFNLPANSEKCRFPEEYVSQNETPLVCCNLFPTYVSEHRSLV